METNQKKRTFRFTMIFILTCMILLSSGLVFLFSAYTGKDSVTYLTGKLMNQILSHTLDRSINFFEVASINTKLSEKLANAGILQTDEFEDLVLYSREILNLYPHFEMIYYGDFLGNFVMVKKMPDESVSVKLILRQRKKRTARTYWIHQNPIYSKEYPDAIEDEDNAYDPRKRLWYQKAQKAGTHIWTDAYIFYTDKKPGITSAVPIYFPDGSLKGVISIDIGLSELSYFLSSLKISPDDRIFLLNEKNDLVALPASSPKDLEQLVYRYTENSEEKLRLYSITETKDPIIKKAFELSSSANEIGESAYIIFPGKDDNYISKLSHFPKYSDLKWKIGIAIPEKTFMEKINFNNKITLIFCIVFVIVALLIGVIFSKRISTPLAQLAKEMDKIKEFDLESSGEVHSNLAEVNNISSSFERMRTAIKSFMKYVPAELVKSLVHLQQEAVLGGDRRNLSIFFSDIAGFTSISEKLSPELLVEYLEEYLTVMSDAILDTGGTVDKYIGDAVMAFWGAPIVYEDHAVRACRTALSCQKKLEDMFEIWRVEGKPEFYTRIGIASGDAIVGNMGSSKRINYTVIGDTVNLASRLEGMNKAYSTQIIVSEETYLQAKHLFEFCLVDRVAVKGKNQAVSVYELMGEKGKINQYKLEFISTFEEAFKLYQEKKFKKALELFKYLSKQEPDKQYVNVFIDRCYSYLENPPSYSWDGVFVATSK